MIELTNFDELKEEQVIEKEEKAIAVQEPSMTEKSIAEVGLNDVHFRLNTDKSYEEQAEDVVGAMATVKAISDQDTQEQLASSKKEELIGKQQVKVNKAKEEVIQGTTDIQEAEWESNKILFDTFNITTHLPKWLQSIVVALLTPFFLIFVLVIKIPCGAVRMLIDGLDGIIVRYDKVGENARPKIKVTCWVLFALVITLIAVLVPLKCCQII